VLLEPVDELEHAGLGVPLEGRGIVGLQPKACAQSRLPLKVVDNGPCKYSADVDLVIMDSLKDRVEIALDQIRPPEIPPHVIYAREKVNIVNYRGGGEV